MSEEKFMKKMIGIFVMALVLPFVCPVVHAQKASKIPRIAYLSFTSGPGAIDKAFVRNLRDLGWIEGKNIAIEYRWAANQRYLFPAVAKEVVRLKVDLIVTRSRGMALAAKNATKTIPIVMRSGSDAVENGLVASLARPGGNITGISESFSDTYTKLLEILHETLPQVKRVVFLHRRKKSKTMLRTFRKLKAAAPGLGLKFHSEEFENALKTEVQKRAGALMVGAAAYRSFGRRLAAFAEKYRLPVFSASSSAVEKHFGLLAYGWDSLAMGRRAAMHVDKILKGTKPADIPVELPTKFNLTINLKTAEVLGITIPPEVLLRATEVIR